MFDKNLVLSILMQIDEALGKIVSRANRIRSADDFIGTPAGMEKLDGICMLFMAIGEALKNIDNITGGALLSQYPEIDWKGACKWQPKNDPSRQPKIDPPFVIGLGFNDGATRLVNRQARRRG